MQLLVLARQKCMVFVLVVFLFLFSHLPPNSLRRYVGLPPNSLRRYVGLPPNSLRRYVSLPPNSLRRYVGPCQLKLRKSSSLFFSVQNFGQSYRLVPVPLQNIVCLS